MFKTKLTKKDTLDGKHYKNKQTLIRQIMK